MIISESKKENYATKVSNGSVMIYSDVDIDDEENNEGEYFRPHDFLCGALASCLNITVRMILDKKKIEYEKVLVKTDIDKSVEGITKFLYNIDIIGNIPEDKKEEVINIAGHSPVIRTLSREIKFEKKENIDEKKS